MYANLRVQVQGHREPIMAWKVARLADGRLLVHEDLNTDGMSSYYEEGAVHEIPAGVTVEIGADF